MGPLEGVKVIDMTSVLMGPYATQTLSDYGADVIKVESPDGDITRQIGPARNPGMGPIFLNANRSKRSISSGSQKPAGREVLLRLAAKADVLVYNVAPGDGAIETRLCERRCRQSRYRLAPGCSGSARTDPMPQNPPMTICCRALPGCPHLIARAGDGTRYVPTALADRVVGLSAVGAILASLLSRERTGRGQQVDIPMFETMVGFVLGDHLGGLDI